MPLLQTLAAEGEGSFGGASTAVSRFIADDFDAPLEEFKDYM
jgi:hypothetical protein